MLTHQSFRVEKKKKKSRNADSQQRHWEKVLEIKKGVLGLRKLTRKYRECRFIHQHIGTAASRQENEDNPVTGDNTIVFPFPLELLKKKK